MRVAVLCGSSNHTHPGFFDPLVAQIEGGVEAGLDGPEVRAFFGVATDPAGALDPLETTLPGVTASHETA